MKFINIKTDKEYIKDEDYYLIDGRIVFSEKYLKDKKKCCGGKCEFCPYTERAKGNKELKK
jgi:hypothetical protein